MTAVRHPMSEMGGFFKRKLIAPVYYIHGDHNVCYLNALQCAKKGCKKREVVPVLCSSCNRNHCFAHRLEINHDCPGKVFTAGAVFPQQS
jgi:hypothetical protein